MKILLSLIIFFLTSLSANENWIKIEPLNKTKTPKKEPKLDINLSKIEPVNKMMQKVALIKKLIDATNMHEKKREPKSEKNWFPIKQEKEE
jgi:hypothetical protein